MAKRKMRKFAEGGFTSEQEEWLGGADRTDPYILARMRSAIPDAPAKTAESSQPGTSSYGEQDEMPSSAPITKTVSKTKVAVTKPKSSWDDDSKIPAMPDAPRKLETAAENKARMEGLTKKQALINVSPEDYVPGAGMLKGALKSVVNNAAKNKLKSYSAEELAKMTPKMIGRENLKLGSEPLKIGREPLKLGMKKGGVVKAKSVSVKSSSASKRADGCAIRGKTRA